MRRYFSKMFSFIKTEKHYKLILFGIKFNFRPPKKIALNKINNKSNINLKFLEKIFSVKNSFSRKHKVIRILFLKIKVHIKGAIENYYSSYNKKIGNVETEILHIMANNYYTSTFYNMLQKYNFGHKHLFICYKGGYLDGYIRENQNVIFGNIETLKFDIDKIDKIIIHGLLEPEIFNWLYKNKNYLKKVYWSIWSSDFYRFQNKKADFVRKNVKSIITIYDQEKYIEKYGHKQCFKAFYLNPLAPYLNKKSQKNNPYIQIMVNQSVNSCTIEALKLLSKFKDENLKIITPLSYVAVGEKIKIEEIIKFGKEIFNDKFIPITKYMHPKEYAKIINSTDIMVVNLQNNGAVGNLSAVMCTGGKVFMTETSTATETFKKAGIEIFNYEDIKNLKFNNFIHMDDEIRISNIQKLEKNFSEEYVASLWQKVFDAKETI